MNQKSNETAQKLRGGYYTPPPIARYLAGWAMRGCPARVLEPSCGDGVFLQAIADVRDLTSGEVTVDAVEYDPVEAGKAEAAARGLSDETTNYRIWEDDFFHWITNGASDERWEAIVGNPPYIRYQYFDSEQRELAAEVCRRAGISMSKRTNAWVPFVAAAVRHLAPGGRLAMVVPAEILHVQHSQGLRLLLEREMDAVTIVSFREIVFEGTLQGTVLLLAEKRETPVEASPGPLFDTLRTQATTSARVLNLGIEGIGRAEIHTVKRSALPAIQRRSLSGSPSTSPTAVRIIDVDGIDSLDAIDARIADSGPRRPPRAFGGEWMHALLEPEELEVINLALESRGTVRFEDVAKAPVGIVTGANGFFVVDESTVEAHGLEEIASPMLARASLIDGLTYRAGDHARNAKAGRPVYFLDFPDVPKSDLPPGMRRYVEQGEAQDLHTRYKCRIREPWYKVPYVWTSRLSLLKRCHQYPRLVLNELGAYSTDTAYRVSMKPEFEGRETDLAYSFLNSLTLLHAELLGRHYGGGVLELVPSETAALPVPLSVADAGAFRRLDMAVRAGAAIGDILDATDGPLLGPTGLGEGQVQVIRGAYERLVRRRLREDTAS